MVSFSICLFQVGMCERLWFHADSRVSIIWIYCQLCDSLGVGISTSPAAPHDRHGFRIITKKPGDQPSMVDVSIECQDWSRWRLFVFHVRARLLVVLPIVNVIREIFYAYASLYYVIFTYRPLYPSIDYMSRKVGLTVETFRPSVSMFRIVDLAYHPFPRMVEAGSTGSLYGAIVNASKNVLLTRKVTLLTDMWRQRATLEIPSRRIASLYRIFAAEHCLDKYSAKALQWLSLAWPATLTIFEYHYDFFFWLDFLYSGLQQITSK